ncbi:MAG: DUF445 domain-containing protein [Acidimicrobiales bacterium]
MIEAPKVDMALSDAQAQRQRLLRTTRRRATALLAFVAAVFVVTSVLASHARWLSWVQAAAVASMVGGFADWFAVTALFRRPLGLPIPHTAIIVERKDRFAQTLGSFVADSFFNPDAVMVRVDSSKAIPRAGSWLADEANAQFVTSQLAGLLGGVLEALDDADTADAFAAAVTSRLERVVLAPQVGRLIQALTRDGRHQAAVAQACLAVAAWIDSNAADIPQRLAGRSPWWLPGPLNSRIVTTMLSQAATLLRDMSSDAEHPSRRQLDEAIADVAIRLQRDPELIAKAEELKSKLLASEEAAELVGSIWFEALSEIRSISSDPQSPLRRRVVAAAVALGTRLRDEQVMRDEARRRLRLGVEHALVAFGEDLAGLVTGTIERWDGAQASERLELLLGPDLQYIRINGTVIGALAGLALHAVSLLIR